MKCLWSGLQFYLEWSENDSLRVIVEPLEVTDEKARHRGDCVECFSHREEQGPRPWDRCVQMCLNNSKEVTVSGMG